MSPVRHLIRSAVPWLVCGAIALHPGGARAQATTSLLPDATAVPRGDLRIRGLISWTRWDQFLGDAPGRNIGSIFAVDSLTTDRVPRLAPIERAIRDAAALPNFRLTAGVVTAPANSRVVTFPVILEYGLTRRLTLGVVVPLVETRTTTVAQLNPRTDIGTTANIGPNPAALGNASARIANAGVVEAIRTASSNLQTRLSGCVADPAGAGCAALLGQQAAVENLLQTSAAFATTLEQLYGTDDDLHPGQPYVPLDMSSVQQAIDQRVETLATQLGGFLGSPVTVGRLAAANGPGALGAPTGPAGGLQGLLADAGRDTVGSTDRTSIGDVSVGATYQLLNTFGDTARASFPHAQVRLAVNGTFRFGTGQPANRNRIFDIGTGYGQNGVEGAVAADVRWGSVLSGSAIASYTAQLGSVDVARVPNPRDLVYPLDLPVPGTYSAGDLLRLTLVPRIRLAGYFALTGQYSLVHTGADEYTLVGPADLGAVLPLAPFGRAGATAQQLGFGFTYSTIVGPDRGPGAMPYEVSFTHLETLAGSGGPVDKTFRDQIELRIYLPTRRR